ncbi:MAG TPA: tetratricopeptide repeat protein [Candidatus Acidoferrum sp.]
MARSARTHPIAQTIAICATLHFCGFGSRQAYGSLKAHAQQPAAESKAQKLRNPLNDLLDEAQADLDKNNFEGAIQPLQKFIAEKPDVAFAHFQLAYAYTNLKRPAEAKPEYERAIVLDTKFFEAYLNLGTLLLESAPKEAIAPLRKAVELQPAQNHPHYLLAVALDRSGDEAGAAKEFQQILSLEPNDPIALKYLGWYFLRHEKPAEAEAKFRQALQVEPKDQKALLGLAQSLDARQKPEAAEAYQEYLSSNPGDEQTRKRLVHALIDQKQYDAALAELAKSPDANHPSEDILKLRADIQVAQKNNADAIESIKQAVALKPQDAQLHGELGRLYLGKRDFPNAEKELRIALQLDKNNVVYLKDLTSTYYLGGNYPMAIAGLDAVEKFETPNAGAWFIRALCYDKLVQIQPALDAYRNFLELDQNKNPDQVWQANQRIHVLQKMADKKK